MLLALVAVAVSSLPTLGQTWIVDDDGGAGVDFTTLQAAFDAAAPHDVILVQSGVYAGATLTKGVRVVGQGGPTVAGTIRVSAVPAGNLAVISGLNAVPPGYGFAFTVANCQGTVVGDALQSNVVTVTDSLDVRVHANSTPLGNALLRATNSRVEVTDCVFRAPSAPSQYCDLNPDPTGIFAAAIVGGELHASRSSFLGGNGGDSTCIDIGLTEPGGAGGTGIFVGGTNGRLLLTGIALDEVRGGMGGVSTGYGEAADGFGLWVDSGSVAQISGVSVASIANYTSAVAPTIASPHDPTLRALDLASPGQNVTLRLTAPPGSTAYACIGGVPIVGQTAGIAEDVLVARARTLPLGTVPASGILGLNYVIPVGTPPGTVLFAQATARYPSGEIRRTQSVPLVVR